MNLLSAVSSEVFELWNQIINEEMARKEKKAKIKKEKKEKEAKEKGQVKRE